jgi:hypothetical protein
LTIRDRNLNSLGQPLETLGCASVQKNEPAERRGALSSAGGLEPGRIQPVLERLEARAGGGGRASPEPAPTPSAGRLRHAGGVWATQLGPRWRVPGRRPFRDSGQKAKCAWDRLRPISAKTARFTRLLTPVARPLTRAVFCITIPFRAYPAPRNVRFSRESAAARPSPGRLWSSRRTPRARRCFVCLSVFPIALARSRGSCLDRCLKGGGGWSGGGRTLLPARS